MTIRFVLPWNGYKEGDRATLPSADEARLIAAGIARADYVQDGETRRNLEYVMSPDGGLASDDAGSVTAASDQAIEGAAAASPVMLPPKIYGVVGVEGNVYFDSLVPGRGTDFEWSVGGGGIGTQQSERWTFTPSAAGASAVSIAKISPSTGVRLASASSSLVVAAANAKAGQSLSVLAVGDSLVAAGIITQTLLDRAASIGPAALSLVGSRGTAPNVHEGRGGWKLSDYLGAGPTYYKFTCPAITVKPAINSAQYTVGGSTFLVQEVIGGGASQTLGSELVTNGDFSGGATGWTTNGTASGAGGTWDFNTASNIYVKQTISASAGNVYRVTGTISNYVRGTPYVNIGVGTIVYLPTTNGTFSLDVTAGSTDSDIRIYSGLPSVGGQFSLDNISCKLISNGAASAGVIVCSKVSGPAPAGSGTLTKSNGSTGDATISFTGVTAEPGNPFWDAVSGTSSIQNYLTAKGIAAPSVCAVQLGTNDFTGQASDAEVMAAIASIIPAFDAWIAAGAALGIKMAVMLPPPPAGQDGWGAAYGVTYQRWRYKRNWRLWCRSLIAQFSGREAAGIYVVASGLAIDPVNGFQFGTATPVNGRSTTQVARVSDALHPAQSGYQQIGDALFGWIKSF